MTVAPSPDALVGDLFSEADLQGGFSTDLVDAGPYNLALTARANKSGGGIVFIEGKVMDGPYAGKTLKFCSVVLHKSSGQKSISCQNLVALGLDLGYLNGLARAVGANYEALYDNLAQVIDGRQVVAEMIQNTYTGKGGETTDMQVAPGKITLTAAPPPPPISVGGAAVPTATPAAAVAAPPAVPAAPAPAAVAAPAPPPPAVPALAAVAEVAAPAPVAVPAPVAPPPAPAAPEAAPVAAPAPAAVEAPAVVPVPAPAVPAPVAPAAEGISVTAEPSF